MKKNAFTNLDIVSDMAIERSQNAGTLIIGLGNCQDTSFNHCIFFKIIFAEICPPVRVKKTHKLT